VPKGIVTLGKKNKDGDVVRIAQRPAPQSVQQMSIAQEGE